MSFKNKTTTLLGIANTDVVFVENRKYEYEFNGKTTIITPTDTPEGKTEISINGLAYIIGMNKCGAILYLKKVKIIQGSKVIFTLSLLLYP